MNAPTLQLARIIRVVAYASLAASLWCRPADACGGLVQTAAGTVAANGQLAVLTFDTDHTDVILTVDVPAAGNDFGIIVPVPAEPTIDADPVSTNAISALEENTRVQLETSSPEEDAGGCGCAPADLAGGSKDSLGSNGVRVGEAVDVGPVTAQWVTGTAGDAITDWLTASDFVLPAGASDIIDAYTAQGMSFLVFTRNDAASADPARIGVRFTLAGDRRAYALKMTRVGAGDELAFTIFVGTSSSDAIGPDAPYESIGVGELGNPDDVAADYPAAVRKAVAKKGGKAFVVETVSSVDSLPAQSARLFPSGFFVTRLSTIAKPADLDADATFTSKASVDVSAIGAIAAGPPTRPFRLDVALASLFAVLALHTARTRFGVWGRRLSPSFART